MIGYILDIIQIILSIVMIALLLRIRNDQD